MKKNKAKTIEAPLCLHCGAASRRVSGRAIYPHRPDLFDLIMWRCYPCNAYVGSHKKSGKPLGRPANAKTRDARQHVHRVLDPLWRDAPDNPAYANSAKDSRAIKTIQGSARGRVYAWLAQQMGIARKDCHTALFTIEQCRVAWKMCRSANYSEIRDWYKENKKILKK